MLLGSSPVEEDSILELALNSNDDPMDPVMLGVEALWCHSSEDGNGYWSGYFIIDISEQELERLLALAISDQA